LLLIFVLLGLKIKNRNIIQETAKEDETKYRWVLLIIQILNNILIFIPNRIKINTIQKIIIKKWLIKHKHGKEQERMSIYN